ncbi:hypothetical protein LQG66_27265 [Bradyrhizobium ontarionense]|uniref:Transcriptional regulator n=1 Tax=Bradyrhizobium ontarionense TaxID=2898149 RepID=A0ABY3R6H7_9BRAD|nr:hypothetical protein [Bradyrhizobium sp. A19]UFZ02930.1 hypothetical protein LQG66_27265 [Bradyrhizobium sp. A19]
MKRRFIDETELAEIDADLEELEALMRKRPRRRDAPAVGGGTLKPSTRTRAPGLRPRPAAFARAIAVSQLEPLAAAFRAGYRAPNRMTVWRLLRDAKVRAEIERLSSEMREAHNEQH